jgi:hypothetical protein
METTNNALVWIEETLKVAKEWEIKIMPETLGNPVVPKQLDFFFIRIMTAKDKNEISRDALIAIVGTLLGQMFVTNHGYLWKVIEDSMGQDLVVENPINKYQLFPFSVVQQRVDAREVGFITKLELMLLSM